jgi:uncharacterized protein YraI
MQRRSASLVAAIVISLGGFLASCAPGGPGPQAWIDIPLDNTTLTVETLNIAAHASDADGVAGFEFYVDDQKIQAASTQGHRQLEAMQVAWTPPGPGTYRIGVRAISTTGTTGALAASQVTITGEASLPVPQPAPVTATVVTPQVTITPVTPEVSAAPAVVARMNANCRGGPGPSWDVYGNLLEGQRADLQGRLADNTWLLVSLVGRSSPCWVAASVVDVEGDLENAAVVPAPPPPVAGQPAEEKPPDVDVIEPEPIEADTTPPTVAATAVDRQSMSCNQTVTSTVIALDDGGISGVRATWELTELGGAPAYASGNKTYGLTNAAWHSYEAEFGPFSGCAAGTLQIHGTVTDNAGLTTDFSQTVGIAPG